MQIRNLVLAVGLLAGCSGKKEVDQMTKYADQMCKCTDAACAEKLFPEVEKWTTDNIGKRVDEGAAKNYEAQLDRAQKCYDKLVLGK